MVTPPHEKSDTDDALVADYGDFSRCPVLHDIKFGHDASRWKIGVAQLAPRLIKHMAERHWNSLEMGEKALVFGSRQRFEEMVFARIVRIVRHKQPPYFPI